MARINRLLNFVQDISLAVQKRTGDNTPLKIEEISEKTSNIKTDNTIKGIVKEFDKNENNFTIGEFVSLEDNSLIPFNGDIYGIVTEISNEKISVITPLQGGEQT